MGQGNSRPMLTTFGQIGSGVNDYGGGGHQNIITSGTVYVSLHFERRNASLARWSPLDFIMETPLNTSFCLFRAGAATKYDKQPDPPGGSHGEMCTGHKTREIRHGGKKTMEENTGNVGKTHEKVWQPVVKPTESKLMVTT